MTSTSRAKTSAGRVSIAWGSLTKGLLLLFLALQAFSLTLYLAPWPAPVRYGSLLSLVAGVTLAVLGGRHLWRWIHTLTLGRVAMILLIAYGVAIIAGALVSPTSEGIQSRLLDATTQTPITAGQWLLDQVRQATQYPAELWAAYIGQTTIDKIPRAEDDVPGQLIIGETAGNEAVWSPPITGSEPLNVELGDNVMVTAQAGSLCQMHVLADGPFAAGTVVLVVEGPQLKEDGLWWRVRHETGSGWCPASVFSRPVR